jgi:hypothetical protein
MKSITIFYLDGRLVDKLEIQSTHKFIKTIRRKENKYTLIIEKYYER